MSTVGLPSLPAEILDHILSFILEDEQEAWFPPQSPCAPRYIPLSDPKNCREAFMGNFGHREVPAQASSIPGLALTSHRVRRALQQYLAERFHFLIVVDMFGEASSRANSFKELDNLDPAFRSSIKHIVVLMGLPFRRFIDGFPHWRGKSYWADLELFERTVENLVELIELLPSLSSMHLEWPFWGNGGIHGSIDSCSQYLFRRMRVEAEGRRMTLTFSAQTGYKWIPDRTIGMTASYSTFPPTKHISPQCLGNSFYYVTQGPFRAQPSRPLPGLPLDQWQV